MTVRLVRKRRTSASRPKNRHALPKDWLNSVPDRDSRPRRLVNGRSVPVKNTASADNARSRAIVVRHGAGSQALRLGTFDLRSTMGKAYRARVVELTSHTGGDPNAVQHTLIDHGARLHLLTQLAWDELSRSGAFRGGEPTPANDAYRRAAADERAVLLLLGLDRKAKDIPDLADYLKSKTKRLTLKARAEDAVDAEEVE
jgi:hypothetical protein